MCSIESKTKRVKTHSFRLDLFRLSLYNKTMVEEWKPIVGSSYEASSLGNIRHTKHCKNLKPRVVNGYCRFSFKDDTGKIRTVLGHRIVFFAFNPYGDRSMEVDHINNDRKDNRLMNLRLLTKLQNNQKRVDIIKNPRASLSVIKRVLELKHLKPEEIHRIMNS